MIFSFSYCMARMSTSHPKVKCVAVLWGTNPKVGLCVASLTSVRTLMFHEKPGTGSNWPQTSRSAVCTKRLLFFLLKDRLVKYNLNK